MPVPRRGSAEKQRESLVVHLHASGEPIALRFLFLLPDRWRAATPARRRGPPTSVALGCRTQVVGGERGRGSAPLRLSDSVRLPIRGTREILQGRRGQLTAPAQPDTLPSTKACGRERRMIYGELLR
jgi:hypothetical protein